MFKIVEFSHFLITEYIKNSSLDTIRVLDATCGNGHDTLFISKLLNNKGNIHAYDIQKQAINHTLELLKKENITNVTLFHQSHEYIDPTLYDLAIFNLGYLPNSNKEITTNHESTLKAVKLLTNEVLALYVEQPNFLGSLEDMQKLSERAHAVGAKFIAGVYPISLALIKKPVEYFADVVVGDCQSLGLGVECGSKTLGFMSVKGEYANKIPGYIAKVSQNEKGELCYRLDKGENSLLLNPEIARTLIVGAYLAYTGEEGLKQMATVCASNAHYLQFELLKAGLGIKYREECFNEFVTISKCSSESILTALAEAGITGGHKVGTHDILWCTTELTTREQMDKCAKICGEVNQ